MLASQNIPSNFVGCIDAPRANLVANVVYRELNRWCAEHTLRFYFSIMKIHSDCQTKTKNKS
jgi:hypothetical protein